MSTPYASGPFDSTYLLTLPPFQEGSQDAWEGFQFDGKLYNDTFVLPDVKEDQLSRLEAGLFELNLDEVCIPSLDASSVSDYATADEDSQEQDIEQHLKRACGEEDVWVLPSVKDARKRSTLTSWDHFLEEKHSEPRPAYLSEAGVDVFDTIVQTVSNTPIKCLKPDSFLSAIYELALGRPSVLFAWDAKKGTFISKLGSSTVSGFNPDTIANFVEDFTTSGSIFKALRQRQRVASKSPTAIAFDAALRSCLTALERYMEIRKQDVISILNMRQVYERPQLLLSLLKRLVGAFQNGRNDGDILSEILRQCVSWSLQHPSLSTLLNDVLATIFSPSLKQLAVGLGLSMPMDGFHPSETPPFHLLSNPELQSMAMETHESLVLLRGSNKFVLSNLSNNGIVFDLASSWDKFNHCQQYAILYERAIKAKISQPPSNLNLKNTHADAQLASIACNANVQISKPAPVASALGLLDLDAHSSDFMKTDGLRQTVLDSLQADAEQKPVLTTPLDEVLDLSLSPLIYAQHRLLSYSILDLLFSQHRLQAHVNMLRQIHLFGDGTFVSRLRMALFDNELASGEGGRRTGATTGLRLQTRDSWPPASSELRLVLMGVLSDTLASANLTEFSNCVSFAIRDLSDVELDLCRAVDSIYALDFLKIHYKPSNPVLETVLSPDSLEKYDRIFKHILRVLRLRSVTQDLLRSRCPRGGSEIRTNDHRLLVEIQHFVLAVADYCHNIAIAAPWARLQITMKLVGEKLKAQDYAGTLQYGKSLEYLRQLHSGIIDDILQALLLKQKDTKALLALEDIFGLILRYAASLRQNARCDDDMMAMAERLRDEFRQLVRRFIDHTEGALNRGPTRPNSEQTLDSFEQLLLRVNFDSYWTKK